jgi:hypothetical protein
VRAYHFLRACNALDDLKNRRLKIAVIDKLNDPFEFLGVASDDPNIRRQYRELKAGFASYMGLICFSATTRNPVQWSHYADHHRGICLGFEISDAAEFKKVNYVDERLKPNTQLLNAHSPQTEQHIVELLTTKFRHWEYEREWRLFVKLNEQDAATGFYWYPFSEDVQLVEVMIGACSTAKRAEVLAAWGSDIDISNARLAFHTFEVVTQRDPTFFT